MRSALVPNSSFGRIVGDHFDEQVLLIKVEGSVSLFCEFRPPSSGRPSDESLPVILSQLKRRNSKLTLEELTGSFGTHYKLLIREIHDTLIAWTNSFPSIRDKVTSWPALSGFMVGSINPMLPSAASTSRIWSISSTM